MATFTIPSRPMENGEPKEMDLKNVPWKGTMFADGWYGALSRCCCYFWCVCQANKSCSYEYMSMVTTLPPWPHVFLRRFGFACLSKKEKRSIFRALCTSFSLLSCSSQSSPRVVIIVIWYTCRPTEELYSREENAV